MNAHFRGALARRKSVRWLIGLISSVMLCLIIGGIAFFSARTLDTHAAGGMQISAGGEGISPFVADTDFTGGHTAKSHKPVSTSGITNPAPLPVYQSNRYGRTFHYTIADLTPNASYTVRLHFAETYWKDPNQRIFNVSINDTPILTNFDIVATAGGPALALVKQFSTVASTSGTVNILFTTVKDNAQVNGIEVLAATSVSPTPTPASTPGGPSPSPTPATTPGIPTPTPTPAPGGTPVPPTPTATFIPGGAPATPAGDELHANSDSSITITWPASAGATSYRIYRSTASGAEGNTPIVTTNATTYKDANLSSTPIYFYQISAVNAAGESARTPEDASKTPPPIGTGGNVAGVPSGNSLIFSSKDALLGGFDWFQTLKGWYPQAFHSGVVDMAYSTKGTMTFNNVVVSKSGLYTITWHYAFASGLFPAVKNRQMGLMVNGRVITSTERFPITGSFGTYQNSSLQVQLNAGVNSISIFAVSDHGISRVDQMTVTPASASVPSGPTNLAAKAGAGTVTLTWSGSSSGNPTTYTIYRGTAIDGELPTPIATTNGTTTTFTDNGLHSGKTYFYTVAANNSVGVSPDSNEISVTAN